MATIIFGHGLMGAELERQTGWDCLWRDQHGIDITKPYTMDMYVRHYDTVINCIGYTKTLQPEREPAWSVNYTGVMDLVDMCNRYNTKLVHISLDFIYANTPKPAKETDCPVHFDNWYTYSKLLSDAYIQARCKDYLLIRTSYKARPFPYDKAFLFRAGNFDYVDRIAELMIELINRGAKGVFNVGTWRKTMHSLALQTRAVDLCTDEVIPADTTMDLELLKTFLINQQQM